MPGGEDLYTSVMTYDVESHETGFSDDEKARMRRKGTITDAHQPKHAERRLYQDCLSAAIKLEKDFWCGMVRKARNLEEGPKEGHPEASEKMKRLAKEISGPEGFDLLRSESQSSVRTPSNFGDDNTDPMGFYMR
eukprot:3766330-Amphidinium_carterae.1